jgi:branched-subunit amino acid transport protein
MEAIVVYLSAWRLQDWDPWTFLTIVLMACITVLTRAFFFISDRPWTLPTWAQRGMQYAPIAALAAVVLPEILMTQGVFIHSLADARIYGIFSGGAGAGKRC